MIAYSIMSKVLSHWQRDKETGVAFPVWRQWYYFGGKHKSICLSLLATCAIHQKNCRKWMLSINSRSGPLYCGWIVCISLFWAVLGGKADDIQLQSDPLGYFSGEKHLPDIKAIGDWVHIPWKHGCRKWNCVNIPLNCLEIMENTISAYGGHILAVCGGKASPLTRQQCIFVMWG